MKKKLNKDTNFILRINSDKKNKIQNYCKNNKITLSKLIDECITKILHDGE